MSNGAYTIGSTANQSQLGTMTGVGIPIESIGFPDTGQNVYVDTSTLPSDYLINQAFGTPQPNVVTSPYSSPLSTGVIDNGYGNTPAYDPTLTSGATPGTIFGGPGSQRATGTGTSPVAGSAGNVQVGIQQGLAKFLAGFGVDLSNWVTRGFLIIIGIVVVAIALVHLMSPGTITRAVKGVAK